MKLLIVDGNSILNRAFYAIRNLTTPDGLHTGGIYGFLVTLFKTLETEKADMVTVAFDVKAPTFRHRAFSAYKATRHGMPEELAEQLPVLKDVLSALRIPTLSLPGYEADDIIGTISAMCEQEGVCCRILTGDRDDLQLVSDKTNVLLTTTSGGKTQTVVYDTEAVMAHYGIAPKALIEVKGLMGDTSDNIPGVKGVGEKTALSLIAEHKTIETVYAHIDEMKGALKEKLQNGKDMAFLSRELGTICRTVPLSCTLADFMRQEPDYDALGSLYKRLHFESLYEKLPQRETDTKNAVTVESVPYQGQVKAKEIFVLFENETVYIKDGEHIYFAHLEETASLFENAEIEKVCHGCKTLMTILRKHGISLRGCTFDTEIAAYLLDPAVSDYAISSLAERYLGKTVTDSAAAVAMLPALKNAFLAEMEVRAQTALYYDLELPLSKVLAEMESIGFLADADKLGALSSFMTDRIEKLEAAIYEMAGGAFNIQSTKQLGTVLFETLSLPPVKKTKSGYSTDASVLEKLSGKHPIVDSILEFRHLAKLRSTYAEGLLTVIRPETGRIHSTFHQTVTATGRISSADPNLQNIPVRTELGREIRKVFVAKEGYFLVDADYSQIELRVLAHMAADARMREAFCHGEDIHTHTAAEIFGVPEFMVTPEMRSRAKTINFGIVYGMGDFTLASNLKISRKEAHDYIESYMKTYQGVRDFMQKTIENARKDGFVKTILQRRRYVPEITASNFNTRAFGERVAMNAPIQGSAADIIKLAMLRVAEALEKSAPRSRLILQVHDELIVEAHPDEVEDVQVLMKREMENAYPLSVPLTVDIGCGKSWYDAK